MARHAKLAGRSCRCAAHPDHAKFHGWIEPLRECGRRLDVGAGGAALQRGALQFMRERVTYLWFEGDTRTRRGTDKWLYAGELDAHQGKVFVEMIVEAEGFVATQRLRGTDDVECTG